VLFAPLQDAQHIDLVLERIRAEMGIPYRLPSGIVATSQLSVGVALYPEHGETAEDLLRKADAEMYRDKRGDEGEGAQANA
jgi:GGDEF domain-containing protein